jgi:hypothetical protein
MNETPLSAFSVSIGLIADKLRSILEAVDDPDLDCEETRRIVKERAEEAQGHVNKMLARLE